MNYPKGAIASIDELMTYKGKTLYPASRQHFERLGISPFKFNGMVSEEIYNFIPYIEDYSAKFIQASGQIGNVLSLMDMHVIPNTYNDWFLFNNKADALDYVEEE